MGAKIFLQGFRNFWLGISVDKKPQIHKFVPSMTFFFKINSCWEENSWKFSEVNKADWYWERVIILMCEKGPMILLKNAIN